MAGFIERLRNILRFADDEPKPEQNQAISNYGTKMSGGYFDEDHVQALSGPDWMATVDKMRRGDSQIAMILGAVKNPLRKAHCEIRPGVPEDHERYAEAEKVADLCRYALFEAMSRPWECVWSEILTYIDFGFSMFWEVNELAQSREFGSYVGIQDLRYVSQKSIETWKLDPATGKLISVEQIVDGDMTVVAQLPGQFLHVFTNNLEGANYEGISLLRAPYGNWFRKNTYLKIEAIGMERAALGIPIVTAPKGILDATEKTRVEQVVQKLAVHEASYAMLAEGWVLDLKQIPFSADTIQAAIQKENEAMVHAVAANFLTLGQGGSGGAYALSQDLSDFFFNGIEHLAKIPEQVLRAGVLRRLTRMNFGPDAIVPKFCVSGIRDDTGKELAEVIQILKNSGAFGYWSDDDSRYMRERFKMPELQEQETGAEPPAEAPEGDEPEDEPEDDEPEKRHDHGKIENVTWNGSRWIETRAEKRASKPQTLMTQGEEGLVDLMRANLVLMKDKMIQQVMAEWDRLPDSSKPNATKDLKAPGVTRYQEALHSAMISLSTKALNQVTDENKWIKTAKFDLRFADPLKIQQGFKISEFKKLPQHVKKGLKRQAELLAETQAADLEKAIGFQYASSVGSTDSATILANDLDEAAERILGNIPTAAQVSAARIVNDTRHFFFFDEDVIEQIESFTFQNPDPVTDICQSLTGRTFSKKDGESLRYEPPLHWNCKSYLEANAEGSKALEKAKDEGKDGLKPSKTLQKQITLSEMVGERIAAILSKPWIEPNQGRTFEIQALSFDPKLYSCHQAESFASSQLIEVARIAMKGERLFGEVKEPRHFDSLHAVNIGPGVKAILGIPKGSKVSGPDLDRTPDT